MGPYRAIAILGLLLPATATAQSPGWGYSPLPGEGDRASMGCATGSTAQEHTCLVVRCEDDFSVGLHLLTSRPGGAVGSWLMTLDREDRTVSAVAEDAPYSARIEDPEGWLLDRIEQGTFVYLRHADDEAGGFAHISLAGSYRAIREALYFCAPRTGPTEQTGGQHVSADADIMEKSNEPTPTGTQ